MSKCDTGCHTAWETTGAAGGNIQSSTLDPILIVYLRTDPHRAPRHRRLVNVPFISALNNYQKYKEVEEQAQQSFRKSSLQSWRAREVTFTHKTPKTKQMSQLIDSRQFVLRRNVPLIFQTVRLGFRGDANTKRKNPTKRRKHRREPRFGQH